MTATVTTTSEATLEKNGGKPATGSDEPSFPTRADIFYDLNGSLGFAVGSSGFILSMYEVDWLPYFRYGSLAWIWGCVFYTVPLLLKLKSGGRWGIGDVGEFLCYLFYVIGCVLGGFFDAEQVEEFLPPINHTFLYGSLSLALEPLYQAWLLLFVRSGSCADRARTSKLCGTTPTRDDDDGDGDGTAPPLKLNVDRFLELNAMIFFCAAGVFGGFPPHPSMALPGVYFWEVGSLFSVARSVLMMVERRRGLEDTASTTSTETDGQLDAANKI